jgi:hypothetical protein
MINDIAFVEKASLSRVTQVAAFAVLESNSGRSSQVLMPCAICVIKPRVLERSLVEPNHSPVPIDTRVASLVDGALRSGGATASSW